MTKGRDRDLGMDRPISRRDFVNGVGIALTGSLIAPDYGSIAGHAAAAPGSPPATTRSSFQEYYPPAMTGMRGSHAGSFEVAHALRDGNPWQNVGSEADTGEHYDLVVVGAGLSGLSGAYFFHTSAGRGARVLVLDNHDDFGGHAKRNEFTYAGRTLLLNGGTSNLESVDHYSTVSRTLLAAIGVDLDRANVASAQSGRFYRSLGLENATFFASEIFGEDRLVKGQPGRVGSGQGPGWAEWLARTPLSAEVRHDIARLYDPSAGPDYMAGLSDVEKKERLARISYRDFLIDVARVDAGVVPFFDDRPKGLFCVGIDAYPALYAWAEGFPGFGGMELEPFSPVGPLTYIGGGQHGREREFDGGPTINLPDGNATVARLLVRAMIPDALPGTTMEDSITARLAYDRLDRAGSAVRIRLNSTAVSVRHVGGAESGREVEVTYVRGGRAERVRADHMCDGVLQRGHSLPLPRDVPRAEGGVGVWGEDADRVHECADSAVERLYQPRDPRCQRSGDVPHGSELGSCRRARRLPAIEIPRRADGSAHDPDAMCSRQAQEGATPARTTGSLVGVLRDLRAEHP